jgi:alpha-tubulin suppressor-like RCC1 family protein
MGVWATVTRKSGSIQALLPHKAVAVTAGYHNNLVLTEQGDVWSWGWGAHGQLGLGDTHDRDRPTVIEDLSGLGVTALSCGDRHSFAVTSAGTVLGWGSNEFGQLGTARRGDTLLAPAPIPALAGLFVVALACGDRHSAAVTNVGAVYTWGCGTDGQCGHGDLRDVPRPRLVEALAHVYVASIHCGHNFTIAMSDKGHVYAWGNNAYGQLGNNGVGRSPSPVRVIHPPGTVVSHVACAHFHCVLITKSDAELAAEQSVTPHTVKQDTLTADGNGANIAHELDNVTVASNRLTAILEEYAKRTARCNATAEKQSRELVIADILRLSSTQS